MKCPTCGHGEHRALRADQKDGVIRRRRECIKCGFRWFTVEALEATYVKAHDVIEAFQGMKRAVGEEE